MQYSAFCASLSYSDRESTKCSGSDKIAVAYTPVCFRLASSSAPCDSFGTQAPSILFLCIHEVIALKCMAKAGLQLHPPAYWKVKVSGRRQVNLFQASDRSGTLWSYHLPQVRSQVHGHAYWQGWLGNGMMKMDWTLTPTSDLTDENV